MTNQTIYTVGGTVQAGGGVYIPRKADEELLVHCRTGEFAFILSSRQVGKSSLMVRTARQLDSENIRSVIIDLSSIGVNISVDEWYLGILNEIANTLELKVDIFSWWAERTALSPATRQTNFFRDVLLKEVSQPVVLFFDEIDTTLSIPFKDDFFTALRAIYNARSTVADFKRLSFVLIGVATPSDLISDSTRTPFNIGRRVELTDFTLDELHPLTDGLGENAAQVLEWVFGWTNGHPYLTQRLCAFLTKNRDRKNSIAQETVDTAVKDLFLGEKGMEDNNLQFVRDMLLERAADKTGVLKIYQQVIKNKQPVEDDDQSLNKSHIKLAGVVRRRQVNLRVSNLIYQNVFNSNWVREHLPRIERRAVVMALGAVSVLAVAVAGLGVTGYLNKIIYNPAVSESKSEWVNVPASEFTMGADVQQGYQICMKEFGDSCTVKFFESERPVHPVYLNHYQIMTYEVTNKQYAQCIKNGVCQGGGYEHSDDEGNILNRLNDEAYANHPVVSVTWFQAESYCQWIGARLPTEAEWEKAARGIDERIFPWGENIDCSYANYGNCVGHTTPVGSYVSGQSPYGVYDMAGNVWEWVADWYDATSYSNSLKPSAVENGENLSASGSTRVVRGGSWNIGSDLTRSAYRGEIEPSYGYNLVGFRCARSRE